MKTYYVDIVSFEYRSGLIVVKAENKETAVELISNSVLAPNGQRIDMDRELIETIGKDIKEFRKDIKNLKEHEVVYAWGD